MDDSQRADVMLREYDTLRSEILQRVKNRYELFGFVGIIAGIVVSQDVDHKWWAVGVMLGLGSLNWALQWLGIRRCAERLVHIENAVNDLFGSPEERPEERPDPEHDNRVLAWELIQNERPGWKRGIR